MITEDRVLFEPADGDYLSVRELTVEGGDRQIGRDLAELARSAYGSRLARYADPLYGRARLAYLDRNWPRLGLRARGVADAFGLAEDGAGFDPTALGYDFPVSHGCSAVWFPPALTDVGRPLVGRNLDWYTLTFSEMAGREPDAGEHPSYSRVTVNRCRPDDGRATLQIGSHDLLNPMIDGVNDAGLFVCILVDSTGHGDPGASPAGGYDSGLSTNQVLGFVLDNAATVGEAKTALLGQHFFTPMAQGEHWLIADADGAATVFEIDQASHQYRFTDGRPDAPLVVTNHALHTYPTADMFPEVDANAEHNTFVRHRILTDAIAAHTGVWTGADITALLATVNCAFADNARAGVSHGWPERTLWTYLADPAERRLTTRFYRRDTGTVPGTNHVTTAYTDPIAIELKS
ncbi:C45 family autoproteolytic acyltransferase/hydolase [Phytomonospora endophytica]|uniref:Peptidase C45 hydrolase domain-containing protein n=1 Tax=Phytomonospora endophytica TaxID=714109 RepID=A0A841FR44_9ACTN|nr:C45 family autoproteolytic acyltransferase/hydolase [Phytomonospora endophytica]MBB6038665.1 hypothetical protein [Phytomonospora endophytica]GIG69191.1 hypothetical protein Pen01_54860 [Phytomonospora endophytica]